MSGSMGGVDSSIALQAKPPQQANPLQQIGEFANTQNALNQTKMFPGQLALQGQQVQGGAVSLAQHINQATAGAMTPLLAKAAGSITHADVTNQLAIAEANHIPTGNLVGALALFPQGDGPQFDNAVRTWTASQAQPVPNAVGAIAPGQVMISNGQENKPYNVTPPGMQGQGSITPASGGVPIYPSRADLAGRVQVGVDAKGVPIYGPALNVTPPSLSGMPGSGQTSLFGTGRLPSALRNPNAPEPTGNVPTGLGPAQRAALENTGTTSAAGFTDVSQRGNQAVQQNAILSNMQNDLAQFSSGTGVNKTLDFKRAMVSWAPQIAASLGIDPKAVAANESFDKLAAQIADAQGAGSDHRLDVTQAANPHAGLSPQGADLIIRQLQGNADYMRAVQQQAAKEPDKSDYQAWSAKMSQTLDPRFFQLNRMTPEQRADYLKAMPEAQKTQFKRSYAAAQSSGLLNAGQ